MVIFRLLLRRFWIQTNLCNCQQYLFLFCILFACNPKKHGQGMMLDLPNQILSLYFRHWVKFCFFPASFISSTYTDKNNTFSRSTNKHSQFGTFSQPYFNRIFCAMFLAICVVVDESKCLDIPIWEFSIILEHLPF